MELIERVQYKSGTYCFWCCCHGISREKLYEEFGWKSLSDRRWVRRLSILDKINNRIAPLYLSDEVHKHNEISLNLIRNRNDNTPLIRTERYENSFFPYIIKTYK